VSEAVPDDGVDQLADLQLSILEQELRRKQGDRRAYGLRNQIIFRVSVKPGVHPVSMIRTHHGVDQLANL
jgi:hypothetical protein